MESMEQSEIKGVLESMKKISDFAKAESNGWIYVKETDAPNVGLVETKTAYSGGRDSAPEITMSAMAKLEDICELFELSYQEKSEEDGVAGKQIEINNRDELSEAIKAGRI